VTRWAERGRNLAAALDAPLFVTPTSLQERERVQAEAARPATQRAPQPRVPALLLGDLAHRFLEQWDFAGPGENWRERLEQGLAEWLPRDARPQTGLIRAELEAIFARFANSDVYAELAGAKILARELPLLMAWDGRIMEGVIDLVYERSGLLYLADYKTDNVTREEIQGTAERYRRQAEIYSRAARRCLDREVAAFKLIFLRPGESVEFQMNSGEELWLF
jgi:ATP-dependent exoDNAse (exonuclease V) beta subunit